ncbi:MAG: hypothetical protein JXQ72_06695, partial [Anaerolineae bacterium]|nr:hypothetical protein [Anaerolineae bacterium]
GDVELGVGCESCHGPGENHPVDVGAIVARPDAQACGQCHIQGQDPSGEHGYPVGYQPGLPLDETVFVPAPLDDESVWWPDGHAKTYNQYSEWLVSGHAEAGISCAFCHDSHPAAAGDPGSAPDGEIAMTPDDTYGQCVLCHGGRGQKLYEGLAIVENVVPVPSSHFSQPDGPRCVTCHMPGTALIGEFGRGSSHTMAPAMPGAAADMQPDSCMGCHTGLVTAADLQQFIDNAQAGTGARLDTINAALDNDAAAWTRTVLKAVNDDGSSGLHNPAYTDVLLDAVEIELGLRPAVADTPSPEELGIDLSLLPQADTTGTTTSTATTKAESGLTMPSIILLVIVAVILAAGAYAFFFRGAES